jgi:hypothetical protein
MEHVAAASAVVDSQILVEIDCGVIQILIDTDHDNGMIQYSMQTVCYTSNQAS